jgi:acylphosphatase
MKQAHVDIYGDVTGVGYRSWTVRNARTLELVGWVRNAEEGHVEALFEGTEVKIKEMITLCHAGPEVAWVEKVEVKWGKASGKYDEFGITY